MCIYMCIYIFFFSPMKIRLDISFDACRGFTSEVKPDLSEKHIEKKFVCFNFKQPRNVTSKRL